LCTSHANVRRFGDLLRERTTHDVLVQGDADTGRLTRSFVEDETSVLVGTRSFWAGIDVPGVTCVLVAIDRIPFPNPSDPLHAARRDRAERNGLNAFAAVDVPTAALVLAQGAGRLLRTRDDRGVVAVLDPRLATRDYRKQLLAALPPFRRSIDLAEACAFLEHAAGAAGAADETGGNAPPARAADMVAVREAVACPECDAAPGERCHEPGGWVRAIPHPMRVDLYLLAGDGAGDVDPGS
jgi:ATP-dependent DNA helicase DinG